ncbi:MAG: alpha/beta hydrolase [Cyanobacteria bacterium P01_F01_bin.53]
MGQAIIGLIAGSLCFLSLWIVLPAPNLWLLRLSIGAPEVSPLLVAISAIALLSIRWLYPKQLPQALIALLLISLALSSLPLLQQPNAVAKAEASFSTVFPNQGKPATNPTFSLINFVKGFSSPNVRVQTGIPFAAPDGVSLTLDVYQPAQSGKQSGEYPAVITIYGGSWSSGSPQASAQFGRYLAARGYVVTAIDYRHAPAYRFPTQLEDVQNAIAFVREHAKAYEIDPARISLVGWSAGAHLALLAGFQSTEPIRSIINYYSPVDLTEGYTDLPSPDPIDVQQTLRAFIGGSPSELPSAYVQASPSTYVKAAKPNTLPPVLLIYGGRDHIVEARFGQYLHEIMAQSQNKSVWVKIPWADHAFDKVFNGVSNQLALHFVERFLHQTL